MSMTLICTYVVIHHTIYNVSNDKYIFVNVSIDSCRIWSQCTLYAMTQVTPTKLNILFKILFKYDIRNLHVDPKMFLDAQVLIKLYNFGKTTSKMDVKTKNVNQIWWSTQFALNVAYCTLNLHEN